MSHKTIINGTSYEVIGGRTLVVGTVYDINKGRTLVNGTGYDIPFGVKWLKYSCNVVTNTTYTKQAIPSNIPMNRTENSNHRIICYSDYIFAEDRGFEGRNKHECYGNQATGYYYVDDTDVYQYANPTYSENEFGQYTHYTNCPHIAEAAKRTTTTYSKGGTGYGAIYVDKNELPESGQLIEGSADGEYCVIKINDTCYYYEMV